MRKPLLASAVALALWFAVDTLSTAGHAQEVPPPPPPPGPAEPPTNDEATPEQDGPEQPEVIQGADPTDLTRSDSDALDLVRKAAARQGGKELAAPGGLETVRAIFRRVVVKADGENVRETYEADPDGVVIDWMEPNKIRTSWTVDGKTTVRGHTGRVGWIDDGTTTSNLLGERYERDREQLERDQRMVGALLDVAFLAKMLRDGSVWKVVRDSTYPGRCVARIAPEQGTSDVRSLDMRLWLDPETLDPTAAIIQPDGAGTSMLHYKFTYNEAYPAIHGAEDLHFPFHVVVYEQRIPEQDPFMIMDIYVGQVHFNDDSKVTAETFRRPQR